MTDNQSEHFDLVFRSWIPVVTVSGRRREVGLLRLFREAHRIQRIVGATPPTTVALHRLAFMVLRRAFGRLDEEHWLALWAVHRLPGGRLRRYLTAHRPGFDLLHPERPFLQDPRLATHGPPSRVAALVRAAGQPVADSPPDGNAPALTPAEAARWLVTARMCPAVAPPAADASECRFVDGLVEGADLKETLLLNFGTRGPAAGPVPARARPRVLLAVRRGGGGPEVTGVWLAPGDRAGPTGVGGTSSPAPARSPEPSASEGADGSGERSLHQDLWNLYRDFVVGDRPGSGPPVGAAARRAVATLAVHGWVSASASITARLLAQDRCPADSRTTAVDLPVALPAALLTGRETVVLPAMRAAVALAERVGRALDELKSRLSARAARVLDPEPAHWPALWARISAVLADLARAVVPTGGARAAAVRWARELRGEAWRIVDSWVEHLPDDVDGLIRLYRDVAEFDARLDQGISQFITDMSAPLSIPWAD
ncbi:type I-E CRISPR-associated protein Cse1/CasA [Saccharothrix sp. NPDC042600]|uniref:type I-E CRISPR-associated protein Cse1/CasA n=1 Tax=Saccharothrix TaxID=2071 RepID=UPI003407063D|nr:hypothetical protein GCM10017745_49430 [Saccharothrix mutabilis subsp. capreolus]